MKSKLVELRDEGIDYCLVRTKQGRDVWIDLNTPDPRNISVGSIERCQSFFGLIDLEEAESGWYFSFDDIEKIIESKE